jgi:2-hydroxychromene-2-carboxylate isomerase
MADRGAGAEAVVRIAAGLGLDAAETAAAIQRPEVKDRLRAETEAAAAKGVFGSPFFLLDGEAFWGADRLDQLDWRLQGGPRTA